MITNKIIGKDGRLGNQMFQYASIVGLAIKNTYSYCFPTHLTQLNIFNLTCDHCYIPQLNLSSIKETDYIDNPKEKIFDKPDNTAYIGYFQNYKYFDHCKEFIKQEFSFKKNMFTNQIDDWFGNKELVSIHIRRQDYLQYQDIYTLPSIEWYIKAMDYFPNQNFIIFSDDKQWCSEAFSKMKNVIISPFHIFYSDLYAMTKCIGHILSNSTFGWWGAYLSDSQNVIMPEFWVSQNNSKAMNWFNKYYELQLPSWKLLPL